MNNKSYVLILALICLAIFFPHLKIAEVNIMEARNFITAREMLQYDNWLHTTMNLLPRYEKPPLPTWLTALAGSFMDMGGDLTTGVYHTFSLAGADLPNPLFIAL